MGSFDRKISEDIKTLVKKGFSPDEVEKRLREKYKKTLSFTSFSYFTYFFLTGLPILLISVFFLKVFHPVGFAYFINRLILLLAAMATLKGFVGHFVAVFLKRETFENEMKKLKKEALGVKNFQEE